MTFLLNDNILPLIIACPALSLSCPFKVVRQRVNWRIAFSVEDLDPAATF